MKIMTSKSGPMEFGVFLDKQQEDVRKLLFEIFYAHRAYEELPRIFPILAERLDKEIVASSIFSTTSIEGTALENEAEVAAVIDLPPEELKTAAQRASVNMKNAYDYAREQAHAPDFRLTEEHIKQIHSIITEGLPVARNVPGHYRDNPGDVPTYVGHERVGGVYRPPKTLKDIEILMKGLIKWVNSEDVQTEDPLIVAPIMHLYFELIHPFWDGNGRVGRVLETMTLKHGGYRHAPFLMAAYYRNHIEEYFRLFNQCRKAMGKKDPNAHYPFVKFFLEGFLGAIEETKNRSLGFVRIMTYRDHFAMLLEQKFINKRQHAILLELLQRGSMSKKELEVQPWYKALYYRLTPRTRLRDLSKLRTENLLYEKDGRFTVFDML